jgi:hypothetical protein
MRGGGNERRRAARRSNRHTNAIYIDGGFHGQVGNCLNTGVFYSGHHCIDIDGDFRGYGRNDALLIGYPQNLWITVSLSHHIASQPSVSYGDKSNWLKIGQVNFYRILGCRESVIKAVERLMTVFEDATDDNRGYDRKWYDWPEFGLGLAIHKAFGLHESDSLLWRCTPEWYGWFLGRYGIN